MTKRQQPDFLGVKSPNLFRGAVASSAAPQALLAPAVAAALPHQLPFRGRVLTARLPSGGSGLDPGQLDLGAECGNRICKCGSCSSSLVGGARGIPEVPQ